ncbi:hypothetical protein QRD02_09825 [Aequorivita sp. SDUM287046]|uniref:Tetratricopeptide repeat protein n=1 Tax=Aequorivita aurantiaca TaxID=3053356 RepID=A0ABT8DH98_9FLAO|nr:hypothetical protein [Aequorivita aurantiaca]MDN3724683.1 hypothetical protein [Aequorivita aurantiaca]
MKNITTYALFFLMGSLMLFGPMLWAQQQTDSIIEFARRQIYENPNLAIETAENLLKESNSIDIKVRSLIIISTAYSSKREYEKSLEYSRKAMEMFPKITDVQLKINLLNRIGGQYQELNVYDRALTYLDDAYTLLGTLPESTEKSQSLGFNHLVRGFIYREQMSCEIALDYFNSAIAAYQKILIEVPVNSNLSIAFYNKGNCLLVIDKINEAEESFLQSITYAEKNNAKSLIAFAQKGLANVYTMEGQHTVAIQLLLNALENSEKVGDKILNRSIYTMLANNYLALGDIENYEVFENKSQTIHDEIIKTERRTIDKSIYNLMRVNSEKVENLNNTNNIYKIVLIVLMSAIILILARFIFSSEKTLKALRKELKF